VAVLNLEAGAAETVVSKVAFDIRSEIRRDPRRFGKKVERAKARLALTEDCYEVGSKAKAHT
jgi:hypothetical protein